MICVPASVNVASPLVTSLPELSFPSGAPSTASIVKLNVFGAHFVPSAATVLFRIALTLVSSVPVAAYVFVNVSGSSVVELTVAVSVPLLFSTVTVTILPVVAASSFVTP